MLFYYAKRVAEGCCYSENVSVQVVCMSLKMAHQDKRNVFRTGIGAIQKLEKATRQSTMNSFP